MAELDLNQQQSDETEHRRPTVQLFSVRVKAVTGQAALGDLSWFDHGKNSDGVDGAKLSRQRAGLPPEGLQRPRHQRPALPSTHCQRPDV